MYKISIESPYYMRRYEESFFKKSVALLALKELKRNGNFGEVFTLYSEGRKLKEIKIA